MPYLLEEAYETLDAIRDGNAASLREELGDLLLQIVLHSEIASEGGAFDFEAVARGIGEKMVRRHPHVWGDEAAGTKRQHSERWTELKQKERQRKSRLDGTPKSMPSMQLCGRYGEIAASVGFDWKDSKGVRKKLAEEVRELDAEIARGRRNKKRIAEELGDVLFTLANLARHLGINPEVAGRSAALKFARRFIKMEKQIARDDRKLSDLSEREWEAQWRRAKQ